jgi:hypothetical protein
MTRINIGSALIVTGFAIGLTSLWATFSHISDPGYLLAALSGLFIARKGFVAADA